MNLPPYLISFGIRVMEVPLPSPCPFDGRSGAEANVLLFSSLPTPAPGMRKTFKVKTRTNAAMVARTVELL